EDLGPALSDLLAPGGIRVDARGFGQQLVAPLADQFANLFERNFDALLFERLYPGFCMRVVAVNQRSVHIEQNTLQARHRAISPMSPTTPASTGCLGCGRRTARPGRTGHLSGHEAVAAAIPGDTQAEL